MGEVGLFRGAMAEMDQGPLVGLVSTYRGEGQGAIRGYGKGIHAQVKEALTDSSIPWPYVWLEVA
jgi:hypothetical protein